MVPSVKSDLQEIHHAETKAAAMAAIEVFKENDAVKYVPAVACLTKNVYELLAFFDFSAEHWDHLRTSNPIESVFATVRHRTVRTKGALSQTDRKTDGLRCGPHEGEDVAQALGCEPVVAHHRRCQIHERRRSRRPWCLVPDLPRNALYPVSRPCIEFAPEPFSAPKRHHRDAT